MPDNIVLIGFKACGKSTMAYSLAAHLHKKVVDTDALLQARFGMSCPQLYRFLGQKLFRKYEQMEIARLHVNRCIIATGGGAALDPLSAQKLKSLGVVVFLHVAWPTIRQRLNGCQPAFCSGSWQNLQKQFFKRLKVYRQLADIEIQEGECLATILASISRLQPLANPMAQPLEWSSTDALPALL